MSAFGYLLKQTARNWVRAQVGRLRRARYLFAVLAGGLYFYAIFFRQIRAGGGGPAGGVDPEMVALASLFVAMPIAFWWLARADPRALAFSDAEIGLLFPAPLTRRTLILYKLARGQFPVLLNVTIFTIIFLRDGPPLTAAQRAIGFWILFTTLYLHRLGAALTRLAGEGRVSRVVRLGAPALVIGAALVAIAFSLRDALPRALAANGPEEVLAVAIEALSTGVAGVILSPFRALMAPAFTLQPVAWAGAVGVALLIMLSHLIWVIRADVAFEDAAAAAAAREAERTDSSHERRSPRRSRWRLPRLPLAAEGRPERAILWKNSVPLLDGLNLILVSSAIMILLLVAYLIASRLPAQVTPGLVLTITALVGVIAATVLGPFAIRDDLRSDLPRLALLRTLPLSGESMVRMQILSVAVPLALVQFLLLLLALAASLGQPVIPISLGGRVAIVLAVAILFPLITVAGVWVQNAVALLFPDWVPMGRKTGGGIESTGQGMLLFGATLLSTALLLLVPVLAGAVVLIAVRGLGLWSLVPAAAGAAVLLALELRYLLRWLGGVFERTDPVDAGLAR